MPPRTTPFIPEHYYHIYNRGVNRQPICLGEDNWIYFITRMREYFQKEIAEIVAYCLMPNHFHVLALIKTDDFSARIMQPLGVSYTKAVNKQQNRVGPLFLGPFRAVLVDSNDYLLQLSRYIHLNPTAAGLVKQPEEWLFSSYRDTIGMRNGQLAHSQIILEQFGSVKDYQKFVEEGRDGNIDKIAHLLLDD